MIRNRVLSVFLALLLLIHLSACAALSESSAEPDYDEVFVIVHTNDVHGFINVEPYVKAVADDMKARYGEKNVITVSAGDVFTGGNAVAHLYNGETIPPIMDAAGYDILAPGNNDLSVGKDQLWFLAVTEVTGAELLSRMASSVAELPAESPMFCQISGASYGYLKAYALADDGTKTITIINPMVGSEPLAPEKIYRIAFSGSPYEMEELEPVISTMEEAAAAMGEYLKSGKAVILPDVPVPDGRIVPMDEIPSGAVVYEIAPENMSTP